MEKSAEIFDEIVNRRRSYRLFDTVYGIPDDVVKRSLHRATLAPNSSNMQLWEFYRIKSKDVKDKVAKICMGQSGAVTSAEIVVFVARGLWVVRFLPKSAFVAKNAEQNAAAEFSNPAIPN